MITKKKILFLMILLILHIINDIFNDVMYIY